MKSLASGLPALGSQSHRPDRRSHRLIARLLALGAAGALVVALMPATALATNVQPNPVIATGDWTQFHNGPTREGYNTTETTISAANVNALGVDWTGSTGSRVASSPAVANGVVYAGSYDGKLYAFHAGCADPCSPVWTGAVISGTISSSPAVANGVVYVGSDYGKLYAFTVGCSSGGGACTPLWVGATTGGAIGSSPAVDNGVVYVGSYDHKLYAYAVGCSSGGGTCTPLWTGATGGAIASSPAVANGVVYVGSVDHKLYAFAVTGDWTQFHNSPSRQGYNTAEHVLSAANVAALGVKWTGGTGGAISSSPAVANGVVYVGSNDNSLYAYAVGCASGGGSCPALWTAATGSFINSSPAVANGVVYVGSGDGKLYAYAVGCNSGGGTCSPIWTATTGSGIASSPAVSNGVVYVGSEDHKLYAYAVGCNSGGGSCTPLWTGATGNIIDSSPAVADGVVYVGSFDHKLYAFAVGCASGGASCSPLWTATTGDFIYSSPAVAAGVVYVGSNDHKLYGFGVGCASGGGSCTPLWTATTGGPVFSSPVVANGQVYVGSDDAKLYSYVLTGATYHPMTPPVRLLDTRIGNGLSGKLAANTPATFQVTGRGGIPLSATAVTGNVTVVNSSNSWAIYLGPNPVASPTTSTINFASGEIAGNGLTVALSTTGSLSATYISSAGNTTDLVFDVTGYFTPDLSGASYHPLAPARLLDTRSGNGLSGALAANTPATFQVTGRGGVPANATAVTGNVTVVNSTNSWAVYLGPAPVASPTTSTINFNAGQIKGNSLTVALSGTGSLSATYISTAGNTTDLVFDVTGYYAADFFGSYFVPLTPGRLLDTRVGNGLSGKFSANTPRTFAVTGRDSVPSDATAVTGNVTVVNETNSWAVFLGPDPTASPSTSTVNFNTGDIKGNGLTVALGAGGTLSATYISTAGNTTDLVFDVTGYYFP
jgi:outer membrane protein assembly factor BamB